MIREFWAENYLSIKDRQVINFESNAKEYNFVNFEVKPGRWLNKIGIMYGANASGKSNMLFAISNVFEILYKPLNDDSKKVHAAPAFAMKDDEPSTLYVSFYANSIRYDYQVSYTPNHIISEELYYYPHDSKSLFYQRQFVSDDDRVQLKFGSTLGIKSKDLETFLSNTLNNHSVLSSLRKASYSDDVKLLRELYRWISAYVHDINGDDNDSSSTEKLKEVASDRRKYRFYMQMLNKADFNISSFKTIKRHRDIPAELKEQLSNNIAVPKEFKEQLLTGEYDDIDFTSIYEGGSFQLPFVLQSRGTLKYLKNLNFLYDLITGDHEYFLDELDEDLHYDLLVYYLNVFLFNSSSAQLIFTTQESALLSEDFVNEHRDLVWFVEKDKATAASRFTRADKMGLHKNLSLYKSYRIGRLGAKPELGSPYVDLDAD